MLLSDNILSIISADSPFYQYLTSKLDASIESIDDISSKDVLSKDGEINVVYFLDSFGHKIRHLNAEQLANNEPVPISDMVSYFPQAAIYLACKNNTPITAFFNTTIHPLYSYLLSHMPTSSPKPCEPGKTIKLGGMELPYTIDVQCHISIKAKDLFPHLFCHFLKDKHSAVVKYDMSGGMEPMTFRKVNTRYEVSLAEALKRSRAADTQDSVFAYFHDKNFDICLPEEATYFNYSDGYFIDVYTIV